MFLRSNINIKNNTENLVVPTFFTVTKRMQNTGSVNSADLRMDGWMKTCFVLLIYISKSIKLSQSQWKNVSIY